MRRQQFNNFIRRIERQFPAQRDRREENQQARKEATGG